MTPIDEARTLSQPCTLRFEDQEGSWLAACWRKGGKRTEGTMVANGKTIEDAARALVQKIKRRNAKS